MIILCFINLVNQKINEAVYFCQLFLGDGLAPTLEERPETFGQSPA
jgi:hypothetical protein